MLAVVIYARVYFHFYVRSTNNKNFVNKIDLYVSPLSPHFTGKAD